MKRLILVRHAKSSWKNDHIADLDRPLNGRGRRDAPYMAEMFSEQQIKVDAILTSPATRALRTAQHFAEALDFPERLIQTDSQIYYLDTPGMAQLVRDLPDEYKTVMIFGHNPGLTLLANHLVGYFTNKIKTTGIAMLDFDLDSWMDIKPESGTLFKHLYPKQFVDLVSKPKVPLHNT